MAPGLAVAQAITVDPSSGARLTTSANGTPVLEIVAPDASGLSHNKLTEFNVGHPGLVLGNNAAGGASQIGGYVLQNPNLQPGNEARAILTEVTGANPSQLAGTVEVFGRQADVFIANKNGLHFDGVTFLNAGGVTATTGTPIVGPDSLRFRVDGGRVDIGSGGVDTTGLSFFDIVARQAQLNGALGSADQATDLNVVAGLNTYDAGTRTHAANASPAGQASGAATVAITGDVAGAMHGRNITFVSTESGAGVRHAGAVLAAQDIVIDARGPMQVGTLQAGRDVDLRSSGDLLVSDGAGIDAGGAVRVASEGSITVAQGTAVQGDTVALEAANRLLVQAAHLVARNTTLDGPVKALRLHAGDVVLEGELVARNLDGTLVSPDQPLVVRDGQLQVLRSASQWDTRFSLHSTATITSGAGIEIVAERFVNDEGIVRDTGRNGSTIQAREVRNSGLFSTDGSLALVADLFASTCTEGADVGGVAQPLCAGFTARGDVTADVGQMTLEGALLTNGVLVLTLGDGQHAIGGKGGIAGGQVDVRQADGAQAHLATAGEMISRTGLSVQLDGLAQATTGKIVAQAGELGVRVARDLVNAGEMTSSGGDLIVSADNVRNQTGASLSAMMGEIRIDAAQAIVNEVDTRLLGQDIAMHAGSAIDNSGLVLGDDKVYVLSDGTLTNSAASVMSANVLHLAGDRIVNEAGTLLQGDVSLSIHSAGDVVNIGDSTILSYDTVDIRAGGDVINDGSTIIALDTTIDADGRVVNRNGASITSEGVMSLRATGDVTNEASVIVATAGSVSIAGADVVNRDGAAIQAADDVSISASGHVDNDDAGILGNGTIVIAAGGNVTNRDKAEVKGRQVGITAAGGDLVNAASAVIRAEDTARLAAAGNLVNDNAAIVGTRVELDADAVDNRNAALVEGTDAVDIDARQVANTGGAAILGQDIDITATTEFTNDTGAVVRGGDVAIDTATVQARDGQVLAEGHLDIRTRDFNNTATLHSKDTATLTMKDGRSLVIDAGHHAPTADTLLTVHTHDLTIAGDGEMRNPGSIAIHASGNVQNGHVLMTGRSLSIDAAGSIENTGGALIWAADSATFAAGRDIVNQRDAQIQTLRGDIDLVADTVRNDRGRIASGRDLVIDAAMVVNQGSVSGGLEEADTEHHVDWHKWWHNARSTEFTLTFDLPQYTSDLAVTPAVMAARGDIRINQRHRRGTGAQVHNNDGQLLATRDVLVDGHLHNRSTSIDRSVGDYIRDPATAVHLDAKDKLHGSRLKKDFASFFDFLDWLLGDPDDDWHRIVLEYGLTDSNLLAGVKKFTGPQYNQVMSAILGADYKDKGLADLSKRWAAFKAADAAGTAPAMRYYGDRRAEISAGGAFEHTGGTFHNGGEQKEQQRVEVTIGSETVSTIQANFDTVFGGAFNVHGDYDMGDLVAWLNPREVLDALRENLMFKLRTDPAPPLVLDDLGAILVGAAIELGGTRPPAAAPKVWPLFETNNAFIDPSLYFNSADFLQRMGVASDRTVPVLADSYAMHVYAWGQVEHTLGNWYAQRYGMDDIQAMAFLADNGLAVAGDLGLRVGEPLTKEQYENLDQDIVWLERTVVNGQEVLHLQFYPSKATLEARSGQSHSAAVISAGGDVSIDATNVQNVDGLIQAGGSVHIASAGDVVNQASGGGTSGIRAEGGVNIEAAGDIENTGATIEGHDVRLAAEGDIDISTTMRIDEDGNLVSRRDGSVFGNGEDNQVHFEAGGDITLTAVEVDADTLRLKAGGDVNVEDVHEVRSFFEQEFGGRFLGHSETTRQGSHAASTGSSLTARDRLILEVGGDFTITGGSIDAMHTSGSVGGDFTAMAGKDLDHYREDTYSVGWEMTGRVSAFGHEATGTNRGTSGGEGYAGPLGDGMNTGEAGGGRPDAMHNTGGVQARWGFGIDRTSDERDAVTYTNVQLNLGSGVLDVDGTFDFGGADLNAADYQRDARLEVDAGRIATTKYENSVTQTASRDSTFVGYMLNASSSVASVSNEWGKKGTDYANGRKEDGLIALAIVGQATQVAFDELGSVSGGSGITNSKHSSSRQETSENINTIGGNFTFRSKTDIDLTGVQTSNPDADIVLDAAGDVNLRAARSTVHETTESVDTMVMVGVSAGYTPAMGGGVGVNASYEGGTENTSLRQTTWQNTQLGGSGANVTIRSGGNTTLQGAVVDAGGGLDMDVGGNLRIESLQDEQDYERVRATWGVSGGVAFSDGKPMPTGSFHAEGGEDYDNSRIVQQQSGIRATPDSRVTVAGDVALKGGFITGGGEMLVGGDIHAETLVDTREKDGGYGGGGGGISKIGKPTASIVGGRVDHSHYEAENRATIDMDLGGLPGSDSEPTIHGDLNTDPDKAHVVTRDDHYAGTDMRFSIGSIKTQKASRAQRTNRVAPAPDAPSTPRPPASGGDAGGPTTRPSTPGAGAPSTPRPPSGGGADAPSTPRPPSGGGADAPSTPRPPSGGDADAPSTPKPPAGGDADAPSTPKPPAGSDGDGTAAKPPAQGDDVDAGTQPATKPKKAPFEGDVRYKNQTQVKKLQNLAYEINGATNEEYKAMKTNPKTVTVETPLGQKSFEFRTANDLMKLHGLATWDGQHKQVYIHVTETPPGSGMYNVQYKGKPPISDNHHPDMTPEALKKH